VICFLFWHWAPGQKDTIVQDLISGFDVTRGASLEHFPEAERRRTQKEILPLAGLLGNKKVVCVDEMGKKACGPVFFACTMWFLACVCGCGGRAESGRERGREFEFLSENGAEQQEIGPLMKYMQGCRYVWSAGFGYMTAYS
jgi:hypothetical protein